MTSVTGYNTIEIYKNAVLIKQSLQPNVLRYSSNETSVTVKLALGDQINIKVFQNTGVAQNTFGATSIYSRFSGFRVY